MLIVDVQQSASSCSLSSVKMSILDIRARFSQRILEAEKEEEPVVQQNGSCAVPPAQTDISEVDVGISEYVSNLPGFLAVIKQRFSDFNVHEIDSDGNIVVLNSYDVPDETVKEIGPPACISEQMLADLERVVDGDDEVKTVIIDVTGKSKEERKNIHQFIKGKYGSALISDTTNEGEKSTMTIMKCSKGVKDTRHPSHVPKFLHCTLSKSNMDTYEALNVLGTKLRIKAKGIAICGTKDKRGNTTQRISLQQVFASKLNNLNKILRHMRVGNFAYKDYSLALGSLKGNRFQIALRGITAPDDEIEEAFIKLKERGFINYFGLQRFGKCAESPSHEIGAQIIKESYGNAVDLILKPRSIVESPDLKQAREIWARTKDAGQAFSALRTKDRTIEGKLLYGLKTHGTTAYANALDLLPRSMRLLYLHSYQSLVWNKVVSRRIAKHGLELLEGDLVFVNEPEVEDASEKVLADETTESDPEVANDLNSTPSPVKVLASDDLSSYSIYDIVMPLPGTSTVYPKNEIAQWYIEILAQDGLTVDSFSSKARQYCLGGSYRKMIERPKNLSWKITRYSNSEDDLILSDIDIMNGKELPDHHEGPLKAAIVTFDLKPSTYATMALREVLRADTSASNQTHLHDFSLKRSCEVENGGVSKKRREDEDSIAN